MWSGDQIGSEKCQKPKVKTDPCRLGNYAAGITLHPDRFHINTQSTVTIFDKQLIVKKATFLKATSSRSQCGMTTIIKNASCLRSKNLRWSRRMRFEMSGKNRSHPEVVKITWQRQRDDVEDQSHRSSYEFVYKTFRPWILEACLEADLPMLSWSTIFSGMMHGTKINGGKCCAKEFSNLSAPPYPAAYVCWQAGLLKEKTLPCDGQRCDAKDFKERLK